MHNFRQLHIWQDSMKLAKAVYVLTGSLPSNEKFGLISQLNRAVVSVPSNIAEGSSRNSNKEFKHFLSIAIGSLFEIETQLVLSIELGIVNKSQSQMLIDEIIILQKKVSTFKKSLTE